MAINKVVNKSTKSHGAMRNVIAYVLSDDKIKEGYVDITGPYAFDKIDWNNVCRAFLHEKKLWNKDTGRMYAHNIISFHKDEPITADECLDFGRTFAARFFPEHQCLIGVHQDKDHLHVHIVTNSVSFIDGRKLHQTKRDLQKQKDFTNKLCEQLGFSVTEKGRHFDGTVMEEGEIHAWNKDKYNLLLNTAKKSFVSDCAIALMESIPGSLSRDDFISAMAGRGWTVRWQDSRKHIVFENKNGEKVRDSNLSKTFNMNIGKEPLLHEFKRQDELRREKARAEQDARDLDRYYADVEASISGADTLIRSSKQDNGTDGTAVFTNPQIRTGNDTCQGSNGKAFNNFLRELDTAIQDAGDEVNNSRSQRRALISSESQPKSSFREQGTEGQQTRSLLNELDAAIQSGETAINNNRSQNRIIIRADAQPEHSLREQTSERQQQGNPITECDPAGKSAGNGVSLSRPAEQIVLRTEPDPKNGEPDCNAEVPRQLDAPSKPGKIIKRNRRSKRKKR